jgi:hypothetical protein
MIDQNIDERAAADWGALSCREQDAVNEGAFGQASDAVRRFMDRGLDLSEAQERAAADFDAIAKEAREREVYEARRVMTLKRASLVAAARKRMVAARTTAFVCGLCSSFVWDVE